MLVRLARERWWWLGFWALLLALVAACALGAAAPLDRDEGAFLVIGQLVLHGRLPYRDVWDQKPPGIYYLLAALLALAHGLSLQAQIITLRLAAVVANALTGLGLLRCGVRLGRPRAGRLAALLWLAACAAPLFGANHLFTEPFATTATVWAAVGLLHRRDARAAFVAGLLLALGTLFKQSAIIALPALALLLYAQSTPATGDSDQRRQKTLALVALLVGVGLPWLALLGVYTAIGAVGDLFYQVVIVNLTGYPAGVGDTSPEFAALAMGLLYCGPLLLLALKLARHLRYARHPGRSDGLRSPWRRESAIVFAALGLLFIGQALPMFAHPYPHYLIQPLPWFALLLALGVSPDAPVAWFEAGVDALDRFSRAARPFFLAMPLLVGIVLAVGSAPANARNFDAQLSTGAWIAAHTAPHARLLIAPAEPEYYYLSGVAPVTPYIYLLSVNYATFPLSQVTGDIRARRFDMVVWFPNTAQTDSPQQYAAMYAALAQNYHRAPGSDRAVVIFLR